MHHQFAPPRLPGARASALVLGLLTVLFALLASSREAAAQTVPLRRPQTPNTWLRPNQNCPPGGATPAVQRVFNMMMITTPASVHSTVTLTATATRTSGTGIGIDIYQGGFIPNQPCVNSFGGSYSNTGTIVHSWNFANTIGFANYFAIVVSGNSDADSGSFTINVTGGVAVTPQCSTSYFSPTWETGIAGAGGSFSTTFTPGPGCGNNWTMNGVPGWVSNFPSSGSGIRTINYSVANNTGSARSVSIQASGNAAPAFTISQLATGVTCSRSLPSTSASIGSGGGTGSFDINASPAGCGWSAESTVPWITDVTSSGSGSGTINYRVLANTGAARTGRISVGGLTFTITQDSGCTIAVDPTSRSPESGNSSGSFRVDTGAGCAWTASTSAPWLSGVTASGTGSGTVNYAVGANSGVARSGSITVTHAPTGANATFTVNQASGCSITLTPGSATPPNAGASSSFEVTTGPGCAWTAGTSASWLTGITAAGTGNGSVTYTAAPNAGVARNAVIQVHATATGATGNFTVDQADGCTTSLTPTARMVGAAASSSNFDVDVSSPSCPRVATSNAAFLHVVSANGVGDGTVAFNVDANPGLSRTGTITVNGQVFTVDQDDGCSASLTPTEATPGASGESTTFEITMSASACPWSASTTTPWLGVTTPSGTGTSMVSYTVQENTGPSRSGTITAAGRTFSVTQGSGCSVGLPVTSGNVGNAGGTSSFVVNTAAGCAYTATSSEPWLSANVIPTGVEYTAAASANASRTATVTVMSTTTGAMGVFIVSQSAGCVLALSASGATATAAGGAAGFGVTSGAGCTWTATSGDAWLTPVTVTASGVDYAVAAHDGPSRTGMITLTNPQTGGTASFSVTQASGCTMSLPVTSGTSPPDGGNASFAYSTGAGCAVTATSAESWLANLTADAGDVTYSVAQNTGVARSGAVTVTTPDTGAAASFTVEQGDGCAVGLPAASGTVVMSGGTSSFEVTMGAGCTWTATTSEPWLTQVSVTATGVSFTAAPNDGLARSGTIVITSATTASSQTFTVDQDGPVVTPVITTQPEDVTVVEGDAITLTVVATGGSLVYQWRKGGVDIDGANGATLTIPAAALSDAGNYDVVVRNPAGSVTSTVAVVVVQPRPVGTDGGLGGDAGLGGRPDIANGFGVSADGGGCNCDAAGRPAGPAWLAALGLGALFTLLLRRRA